MCSKSALLELLSEDVTAAEQRESAAFDRLAGECAERLVLFGAGGLGRRTAAALTLDGTPPLAFSDNRPELWDTEINGIPVLSPTTAAEKFGNAAAFVVTIWGAGSSHRFEHSQQQLSDLGVACVVPFTLLAWRNHERLLPYYALDLPSHLLAEAALVRIGYDLLDDEQSKEEFVAQVRWRLTGDPRGLAHPVSGTQYLVTDIARAVDGDVVLDCGAFDGDSLRDWIADRGPTFARYLAMEPDPISTGRLDDWLKKQPAALQARIDVLRYATSGVSGPLTFAAMGVQSSSADQETDNMVTVEGKSIDDLIDALGDVAPTFIKMDIEGEELAALAGGARCIQREQPMLAISAYHCQNHLWRVPIAIADLLPEHQLSIRPHNEEGFDLICYAVPPDRVP